ncbi:MAG: OmpA family protein [Bacteroidota bacterium]
MARPIRLGLLFAALCLGSEWLNAQEDAEGAKDNPYFTRMPSFFIHDYGDKDFDAYAFFDGKKIVSVEGRLYQTTYWLKEDVTRPPSQLQIRRNFITAIKNQGGTILFEGLHEGFEDTRSAATIITARIGKQGKEIWVEVWPGDDSYTLTVLEKELMRQDVTASDMLEALNKDGYIALDIHFDTGKATIRPESRPVIDQILALLRGNPLLKLSIEGHTDNVGDAAFNKTLSLDRARAVMALLVTSGVAGNRLTAAGFGADRAVADNRTEDGRAKNRRVELVKK